MKMTRRESLSMLGAAAAASWLSPLLRGAEETGEAFDPASVTSGETILRIRGLGAEIPSL